MTTMTPAEARREKRREEIMHALPNADAIVVCVIEDLTLPAEFAAIDAEEDFDSVHDMAEYVEEATIEQIKSKARSNGFQPGGDDWGFVRDEIDHAECEAFDKAMRQLPAHIEAEPAIEIPVDDEEAA